MFTANTYILNAVATLYFPLVERFYADNGYRVKCGRLDRVYTFTLNGKIVAAARFIVQQSDTFLLRNLCVATDYRRQGVASHFLSKVLPHISPTNCYCFISATLQHFYEAVGFACFSVDEMTLDEVPEEISHMHVRQRKRKRGWILMGFIHDHNYNNHSHFTSCL
jgi:N-acetylglutamate synthase-like GNAT family acetyltransferase